MVGNKKILFICKHNAVRSQMAEGYMRARYGNRYDVFSAGIEATRVNPLAIEVMKEIGIDISGNRSKPVDEFFQERFDVVVTVCDTATKVCPFFPGAPEVINQDFPDPLVYQGSREDILSGFRSLRDQIARWIDLTFAEKSGTT